MSGGKPQIAVADNYPIDVHRDIIGRQTDGQRGIGGNRNVNDAWRNEPVSAPEE